MGRALANALRRAAGCAGGAALAVALAVAFDLALKMAVDLVVAVAVAVGVGVAFDCRGTDSTGFIVEPERRKADCPLGQDPEPTAKGERGPLTESVGACPPPSRQWGRSPQHRALRCTFARAETWNDLPHVFDHELAQVHRRSRGLPA